MSQLYDCHIIFGERAVQAYNEGETCKFILQGVGEVKYYCFHSIRELNAFILGIEEAGGGRVLAVDDL